MNKPLNSSQEQSYACEVNQLQDNVPCEKIQEVLFDYMARELGDKQSWLVHEHLIHCAKCRREAAEIEETISFLRKDTSVNSAPDHLSNSVRRRLERIILHPVLDWVYVHRHLVAAVLAVLIIALLAIAAGKYSKAKPEGRHFWINVGQTGVQ